MGIFSFLKNAGAKLFTRNEKAGPTAMDKVVQETANRQKALILKAHVESMNIPIKNLSVDFDGETATVFGEVESQANREKIVLTVGNVDGVGSVDDRIAVVAPMPVPEPEADFYEVKKGDSLSKIAKQYYGDAMKYPVIFEANKPMLKDPDLIYPGQLLRIPKL